ncbi:MAG: type III-A CRISPR-associated RAMP protein Csm5 [Caldilineaceae bacterium]
MLKRNITAQITLLSDLHIGTGTDLIKGLDWIERPDGYVYFVEQATMAATILDRALADGKGEQQVINTITGLKLDELVDANWLTTADFQTPSAIFPYRLRGAPATVQIREQIKTVYGQPYLPGSSLKGALRTLIATTAAKELQPDVNVNKLDRRRTWAARPVEQMLFGRDPNHDFLRMLQVSDSQSVEASCLRLRRAHIYPTAGNTARGRSKGLDVDLEAVAKGTTFVVNVHLPLELLEKSNGEFEQRRSAELGDWERRRAWLGKLAAYGRSYVRQLLIDEVTYFEKRTDVPAVHAFYSQLADRFSKLPKNQFMLPLGWGGGWHTKTLNQYLKQDAHNFEEIARQYRLDPTGDRKAGDRFPKSRHLLRQPDGRPGEPLGWCLVELKAVE